MLISTVQQSDYYTYTYTYTHTYIYTHTYTHICSYYFPLWFNHRILNIVFCAISRTLLVIRPVYNSLCKPMFGECFRTAPTGFIPPVFLPSLMTSYGWICAWSPMVSFVNLLSHLCSLFQKSWLHLWVSVLTFSLVGTKVLSSLPVRRSNPSLLVWLEPLLLQHS